MEWTSCEGSQLERLVGERGFSVAAFAAAVQVSERTYLKWRRADAEPDPENRAQILRVLGGVADPLWDDPRYRELAVAVGARRPDDARHPPAPPPVPVPWWAKSRIRALAAVSILVCVLVWWHARRTDPLLRLTAEPNGQAVLHFASGATKTCVLPIRNGILSWNTGDRPVTTSAIGTFEQRDEHVAILISLDTTTPNAPTGQLRADCIDRRARHRWTAWLDDAPRYGGDTLSASDWTLEATLFLDWDANGTQDLVLVATHTWFPSVLTLISAQSERLRTYVHAGHIKHVTTMPTRAATRVTAGLPSTARTEGETLALSVEWNEMPRSAGLVVLHSNFASGASPATTPHYRHATLPVCADATYIRFLPSLVAQRCAAEHNWPGPISADATTQTLHITTIEEPEGDGVIRTLAHDTLRQVRIVPTDRFRHKYAALQARYALPPFDSDVLAASFETRAYWTNNEWITVRDVGAWQP